ncbi:MAG TPA: hypothetical protein VF613_01110, partial [Longimicrobium sp.]
MRFRFAPALFLLALAACDDPGTSPSDASAPRVEITAPVQGAAFRELSVTVAGRLIDETGVARASLQRDGGPEEAITITPGPEATFLASLELAGPRTRVVVHAYDEAGNRGSSDTLTLVLDTVAPALTVQQPREGGVYTYDPSTAGTAIFQPRVNVKGDDGRATYSVNGGPARVLDCLFPRGSCEDRTAHLTGLLEGENVLQAFARDSAGNQTTQTVRFRWHAVPRISIEAPSTTLLASTTDASIRLRGSTLFTAGEAVRVTLQMGDGPEREIASGTSASVPFTFDAPLEPGANRISVHAYVAAGARSTATLPVVRMAPASTPGTFSSISTDALGSCATTRSGGSYCWGGLGGGSGVPASSAVPAPVRGGTSFARVYAGGFYACGLTAEGAAYCWGLNFNGRLGTGDAADRTLPTPVATGLRFASLSLGGEHACGVTAEGQAYCWGANLYGQLGTGESGTPQLTPVRVTGGHTWTSISAADQFTCGLATTGTAHCWGNNTFGSLGNGSTQPSATPAALTGTYTQLAAEGLSACGLSGGSAFCWGLVQGVQGSGPAAVPGGFTFQALSVGGDHACGLTADGSAYCWGNNDVG